MGSLLRRFVVRRRYWLGVAALVFVTAPLGVGNRPLWVGDETREAAIAKQMADSGDFLRTRLAGRAMLEKPPFFYASVASSIRLHRGVTRFSTRLPSILFSAITLLSAAAVAFLLFSQRAGLFTAAILATTYLFAVNAHDCVVDVPLTAFVSLGLLAFTASSRRAGAPRWDLGFGLAAAGAMLAKGFVGLALLALLTVPFWLFCATRRRLRDSVSAFALLVPFAALLLWSGITYGRSGMSGLFEAFWNQQFGRLLGFRNREYSHHSAPFYFYLAALPGMLFPWVVTLPAAVGSGLREKGRPRGSSAVVLALLTGLAAALLFLSCAGTKRTIYFLPVVPIAAILVGSYLDAKLGVCPSNLSGGPCGPPNPLAEAGSRVPRFLWLQFAAVVLTAVAVPLLPASADGRITAGEAACVGAVALLCAGLGLAARRSPTRLVSIMLAVAVGAVILLDRYSLPRWKRDFSTRDFFSRVERRMAGGGRLLAYDLNEDVLGLACLELTRPPVAEDDPARLEEDLKSPGAYLLIEKRAMRHVAPSWAANLERVEAGRAGDRSVSLYRLRTPQPGPPKLDRPQPRPLPGVCTSNFGGGPCGPPNPLASGPRAGGRPRLLSARSAAEAKALVDSVGKKKPSNKHRQKNRAGDRGDLCAGCLADPERLLGNDAAFDENALDDEIKNERHGDPEQNDLPLARKADRVFDPAPEEKAEARPDHAIDERSAEVAQDKGPELHPGGARGKENDGPQAVKVAREDDQPVLVPMKLGRDLLHFLRREDLSQEPAPLQPLSKKPAKAVQDRIRNHDAEKLRPHHERKPRDPLEHQKTPDQEHDLFGRARSERSEEKQEENAEVALPLQVLRHHLHRRFVEKLERRHHPEILARDLECG
jgi:4-amino-4-deoxy-L-arabinose transferase-like glycosyltransferase